jgi:nucleoid-associated protein
MNIQNIIVHLLEKKRYERTVGVQLRDNELPSAPRVTNLVTRINDLYSKKSGRAYGEFRTAPFNSSLNAYLGDSTQFVNFTKDAMTALTAQIEPVTLATGGYMLFTKFEHLGQNHFMVVMLKDAEGVSFDSNLDVLDVNHLELENLHLAANVNITSWQLGNATKYVSFVKGRSNARVTDYFKNFIGIQEFADSSQDTAGLVTVIRSFARVNDLDIEQEEVLRSRVHAYCVDRSATGVPIFINELSRYIDEAEPEAFLEHVNASDEQINNEIHIDQKGLKRFVRYSGRSSELSISFDSSLYGDRISYDQENDTLIIKGIPTSLRQQLTNEQEG